MMNGSKQHSAQKRFADRFRAHRLARTPFARSEEGSLLVLSLILFLLMCMMGGLAVDVMRFEQRRTELQQTLDRSVLAAASMTQKRTPAAVVTDYFAKAGLSSALNGITVSGGLNARVVTANAKSNLSMLFMQMIDIDKLEAKTVSTAEQRIANVEVSLVLDISGSMNGSRINNLKPAAREFVTSVLATSDAGNVSVSIIPYNAQVNIGKPMMEAFNTTINHNYSYCMELPDSVFTTNDLSRTTKFKHNAHFDPYYTSYNSSSTSDNLLYNCPPEVGNMVTPLTDSETVLHAAINNLSVGGNTAIDMGVKWGAFLLNTSSNDVVRKLVTAQKVNAKFNNRPLNPNTADVLKVLVVMTDGRNTTEYMVNDPYNSGLSNVYRERSSRKVSVYFDQKGDKDWYQVSRDRFDSKRDGSDKDADYDRLTWPQVWADYSVDYVARYFYDDAIGGGRSSWENTFRSSSWSTKDTRLQNICSAAKANNIVIYGIGFEAPSDGRDEVRACATSPSHYFDASGLEITTAFRAIASNMSQLRLTQ